MVQLSHKLKSGENCGKIEVFREIFRLADFEDFWYNSLEIDMDMVVKIFDKLKPKIVKSKNDGLESLL